MNTLACEQVLGTPSGCFTTLFQKKVQIPLVSSVVQMINEMLDEREGNRDAEGNCMCMWMCVQKSEENEYTPKC
jgi:hypothetical protein